MTPKQAYLIGYRHITDLAEMNRIADLYRADEDDEQAIRLIEAWRRGALEARTMLERQQARLQ